jgi:hypothetical protein
MGFQKINIRSRNKIADFLNGRVSADPPLKKDRVQWDFILNENRAFLYFNPKLGNILF